MRIVPNRAQWEKWSLPAKASYVGAVVGVLALVVALITLMPQGQPSPASKFDASSSELVDILNVRAADVLRRMSEEENYRLIVHSTKSKAPCPKFASEDEFRRRMVDSRHLFQELHRENIQAIKDGHLTVSHEVTKDIHVLLYLRTRDFVCETTSKPPDEPAYLGHTAYMRVDLYPGPQDCDFSHNEPDRTRVIAGWLENTRARHTTVGLCGITVKPPEYDDERQRRVENLLNGRNLD